MSGNIIVFLSISIGLVNCSFSNNTMRTDQSELKNTDLSVMGNNDSIVIKYWDAFTAEHYSLKIIEEDICINRIDNELIKLEAGKSRKILKYIDLFFLSKKQPIELSRKKLEPGVVDAGDYSSLEIFVFNQGSIIKNDLIILGDDEFRIEFDPKFEKFISILNSVFLD